jgi:hypothetical protein
MSLPRLTRWNTVPPLLALLVFLASATSAHGATQLRQVRVEVPAPTQNPSQQAGTMTLDIVFKNKRGSKRKFTPRLLTRIELDKIPLDCANDGPPSGSQHQLSDTLDTNVKFTKNPQPAKPKPNRYAFRFTYAFEGFAGKLSGTIDKPTTDEKKRKLRSQGKFQIDDLDVNPGHTNCSSAQFFGWGGLPVPLA